MTRKTFRDLLDAAVACTTSVEAEELVNDEIANVHKHRPGLVREQARKIVMENIGYLSGYLGRAEAKRVLELFGTRHPFLGAVEDWPTDPEDTFAIGMKVALQSRK